MKTKLRKSLICFVLSIGILVSPLANSIVVVDATSHETSTDNVEEIFHKHDSTKPCHEHGIAVPAIDQSGSADVLLPESWNTDTCQIHCTVVADVLSSRTVIVLEPDIQPGWDTTLYSEITDPITYSVFKPPRP